MTVQLTLESAIHEQQALLPADRARLERSASAQADVVLSMFESGFEKTADEVWEWLTGAGYNWPLTSVRRAITNLTTSGHLERTQTMRKGLYGVSNHCWRLAR